MAILPPSPFTSFVDEPSAETLVVAPGPQASVAAASGPFDSGEYSALPPDEAAALPSSPSAAAEITEPTSSTGGPQGSPAPGQELCGAGDLDLYGVGPCMHDLPALQAENERVQLELIGEIFRGARKLNLPRFKLDEERFMIDIEEPPLFLQSAG